uniref:Os01g0778700 protein n=1 Tax=Macrostomum lignano TaxID=282301 RepID=A0A1I8FK78_9PLAT
TAGLSAPSADFYLGAAQELALNGSAGARRPGLIGSIGTESARARSYQGEQFPLASARRHRHGHRRHFRWAGCVSWRVLGPSGRCAAGGISRRSSWSSSCSRCPGTSRETWIGGPLTFAEAATDPALDLQQLIDFSDLARQGQHEETTSGHCGSCGSWQLKFGNRSCSMQTALAVVDMARIIGLGGAVLHNLAQQLLDAAEAVVVAASMLRRRRSFQSTAKPPPPTAPRSSSSSDGRWRERERRRMRRSSLRRSSSRRVAGASAPLPPPDARPLAPALHRLSRSRRRRRRRLRLQLRASVAGRREVAETLPEQLRRRRAGGSLGFGARRRALAVAATAAPRQSLGGRSSSKRSSMRSHILYSSSSLGVQSSRIFVVLFRNSCRVFTSDRQWVVKLRRSASSRWLRRPDSPGCHARARVAFLISTGALMRDPGVTEHSLVYIACII